MPVVTTDAGVAQSETTGLRRFLPQTVVALGVLPAVGYLWAVDPNRPGHYPLCPTFALAGIYCPGCGLLRATHDLIHLDFAGAMARNPLVVPLYVAVGVVFLLWVRATWRRESLRWDPPTWMPAVIAASFVLFTIARNVPGWSWLSPA